MTETLEKRFTFKNITFLKTICILNMCVQVSKESSMSGDFPGKEHNEVSRRSAVVS